MDRAGGLEFSAGTDTPVSVHGRELQYVYYSAKMNKGNDGYVATDFDHDFEWRVIHRERDSRFEDVGFLHLPGHTRD